MRKILFAGALMLCLFQFQALAALNVPRSVQVLPASQSKAFLAWQYTAQGGSTDGFYVERSIKANTGFVRIATLTVSARSYNDAGLFADTDYYYRLRAFKGGATSPYSLVVMTRTLALLAPIVNAGIDVTLTLPDMATLTGTAFVDGIRPTDILSYRWTMASGPAPVQFADETALNTTAVFTMPGTYALRLTATVTIPGGSALSNTAVPQIAVLKP